MKVPPPQVKEVKLFDGYESDFDSTEPRSPSEIVIHPKRNVSGNFTRRELALFYFALALMAIIITMVIVYAHYHGSH